MRKILKKLHKYEIQIRKAVTTPLQGEHKSVFKGTGLEFDDVRAYQYGDDVRTIDWNVSAKGHGVYIKTFKEERDQQVMVFVDLSASEEIGKKGANKSDLCRELTGLLALASAQSGSHVGAMAYTDIKEMYIKPMKSKLHAYQIIKKIMELRPSSKGTNLSVGLKHLMGLIKKRSLIFVISDFIDVNFESQLALLGRKHDVIAIHIYDPVETKNPSLGIIPVRDIESGKTRWINTFFNTSFKKKTGIDTEDNTHIMNICKKNEIDYVQIASEENYVPKLIQLFKKRNLTTKKGR